MPELLSAICCSDQSKMLLRASRSTWSSCGVEGFVFGAEESKRGFERRRVIGVARWLAEGKSTQGSSPSCSSNDHLLLLSSSPTVESHSRVPSESGLGMLGGDDGVRVGKTAVLDCLEKLTASWRRCSGRTVLRTGVVKLSWSSAMLWPSELSFAGSSPKVPDGSKSRRAVTLSLAGGDSSNMVSMRGPRAPPDTLRVAPVRSES